MSIKFKSLNKTIIKCKKCPRLVKFIKKISTEKESKILKKLIGENQLQDLVIITQKS
jgi:hypothetical protein